MPVIIGAGSGETIWLQKSIAYAGKVDESPIRTVTVAVDVPVYQYARDQEGQPVTRRATPDVVSGSEQQPLDRPDYRIGLDQGFIAGADVQKAELATAYMEAALTTGAAEDDLVVDGVCRYLSDAGDELGQQPLTFVCVPKSKLGFLALNRQAVLELKAKLHGLLGDHDGLLLLAIALLTRADESGPAVEEVSDADFKVWLDVQVQRLGIAPISGDAAKAAREAIQGAVDVLHDLRLMIPEVTTLTVAGTLTIVAAADRAITAEDFLPYVLSAELVYGSRDVPRPLTFRFGDQVKVTDGGAPFSLTGDARIVRNDLVDPVTVTVKGIDGSVVWSRQFAAGDPALATLDIRVPLQESITLAPATGLAARDPAKKLRGSILTYDKDCALKDALVLVRAKAADADPWRVVGAATTDASGNFSLPYPYGAYAAAEAVVSLAPAEPAAIPIVANGAGGTISDDFLYLLLTRPVCPEPQTSDDECDCGCATEAGRLPDHDDLVGSDVYSQDLGGSCVNLSKPNRTISEFDYQAIVRMSDPDVENFVLSRVEEGLGAADVSLATTLAASAEALQAAVSVALTGAASDLALMPTEARASTVSALTAAQGHADSVSQGLTQPAPAITLTILADAAHHLDALIAILATIADGGVPDQERIVAAATALERLVELGIDSVGTSARYELTPGLTKATRRPIDSDNPVNWQDAPQPQPATTAVAMIKKEKFLGSGNGIVRQPSPPGATFSQAVTVATGHILHYKAAFRADGYSLGDLLYSLPLAPGQKKEIVVFDASHTLTGTEAQTAAQTERLSSGLVDERTTTDFLSGGVAESLHGTSTANTSGISAGFGTGGQGSGSTGAYGGSGSAVLGVAGGAANANSTADQNSSRDVSQFFYEKLRQSITQNADSFRRLNASVVTTIQEGQRYGVTSEVVANHNHCHALTILYFEVLRHFAIFQELASVEECVLVPFLLTRFTTNNVAKWRDILAPALLPMPSETYLQPFTTMAGPGREHPLIKAFDADQRIKTQYANVDFPPGSYDDEPIRFLKGQMLLRVDLPRPKTRYDRIKSLPVTTKTVVTQGDIDVQATVKQSTVDAFLAGATAGLSTLFTGPPGSNVQYQTKETQVQVKQAIFDAFMSLDANYESVRPADCIRVTNFSPSSISFGGVTVPVSGLDFFQDGIDDRDQWTRYASLMGYTDVLKFLDYYFKGRLISEWDDIFYNDIVPVIFRKIVDAIAISPLSTDLTAEGKYMGGERLMPLSLSGKTSLKRNQLPPQLSMSVTSSDVRALADHVTLNVEDVSITYSTAHYNGLLYGGNVNNDLLDGVLLDIPENPAEKRNPRREDRYLAAKLLEHLNSNLEYYNKVLWYRLDPDRRYMLLDGYSIQVYKDDGTPVLGDGGMRSLASVVKNDMVAVAGNSLVFPVAPGYKVSGSFVTPAAQNGDTPKVGLIDHYKPLTPAKPYRISTPCRGVFAEAVQGACDACERIETDRLQDWSRFPIDDQPTAIAPVGVPTPTVTDWQAAFKDFAAPIVNVQNAPALPATGAGLEGLTQLLAQSGIFKDITGLDANQQNVLRTYLSNQDNAKAFAEMAKEMAMQSHNTQNSGKIMDSIATAKSSGAITQQQAGQLTKDHLQQQIDGGASTRAQAAAAQQAATPSLIPATVGAIGDNKHVVASRTDPGGTTESVDVQPASGTGRPLAQIAGALPSLKQDPAKGDDCWAVAAALMVGWKIINPAITVAEAVERAGQRYVAIYQSGKGLKGADKDDFLLRMEMVAEAPASYGLQQYIDWIDTYGPVWVTVDAAVDDEAWAPHARVLTRISGTGTPDGVGTDMTFVDPATGTEASQPFLEFVKAFEEMARTARSRTPSPQAVHFIEELDKGEGFQVQGPWNFHAPIHESITLAAAMNSDLAVPKTVKLGADQAVNELIRGVIWNDDPAVLMFHEDVKTNWHFSTGVSWLWAFERAKHSATNNRQNLTGRSHFFDLSFVHAMAVAEGEQPWDTLAHILLWAEVMYRLSTGDGIAPTDKLQDIHVTSSVTNPAGDAFTAEFDGLFDGQSRPLGSDTINYLISIDTACPSLDISRRAIGSLLHLVQDSYARGHTRRTLLNPEDLLPGSSDLFKPGTYGHLGDVENFHCYRGQDEDLHDKYDVPLDGVTPDPTDLSTFNSTFGGRDALDHTVELLNLWNAKTPWAANGGPKELLEGTIFKLSKDVTPADKTVWPPPPKP